jgi:hypothetical protein
MIQINNIINKLIFQSRFWDTVRILFCLVHACMNFKCLKTMRLYDTILSWSNKRYNSYQKIFYIFFFNFSLDGDKKVFMDWHGILAFLRAVAATTSAEIREVEEGVTYFLRRVGTNARQIQRHMTYTNTYDIYNED